MIITLGVLLIVIGIVGHWTLFRQSMITIEHIGTSLLWLLASIAWWLPIGGCGIYLLASELGS